MTIDSDSDKLWLEPRCEDDGRMKRDTWGFWTDPRRNTPCPTCGRQPTEYVKKEE